MRRLPLVPIALLLLLSACVHVGRIPFAFTIGLGSAGEASTLGRVAYVRDGDLWVQEVPDGAPVRLTTDGRASSHLWYAAEGTVSEPRWSPSGRWVAYRRGEDELWVADVEGGTLRQVGAVSDGRGTFAWSPSADRLAYVSADGALVVEDAGGVERHVLVPPPEKGMSGGVSRLAWSPDAARIAYDRTDRGGMGGSGLPGRVSSVWWIGADGGAAIKLLDSGAPESQGLLVAGWTPDGAFVLYFTDVSYSASLLADGAPLFAVPAAGGEPIDLRTHALIHADYLAAAPAGTGQVAVVAGSGRETWTGKSLHILTPASGSDTTLTGPEMAVSSPAWSPDGRRIAFVAMPDAGQLGGGDPAKQALMQRRIFVQDPSGGTEMQQLTTDPAYRDEYPRWSADGSSILFARLNAEGDRASLWLVPADGGDPRQVVDALGPVPGPASLWFGYYGHVDWGAVFDWWPAVPPQPAVPPSPAAAPASILDVFPLRSGARWTYALTFDYALNGTQTAHWTGAVTETVTQVRDENGVRVFRAGYSGDPLPVGPEDRTRYYAAVEDRLYLLQPGHDLDAFVRGRGAGFAADQWVVLPLGAGRQWGAPEFLARGDGLLVSRVESVGPVTTPAGTFAGCAEIIFRTNPDHAITWFCPGVGIARFEYHHHGSVHDEVWALTAYDAGTGPAGGE